MKTMTVHVLTYTHEVLFLSCCSLEKYPKMISLQVYVACKYRIICITTPLMLFLLLLIYGG